MITVKRSKLFYLLTFIFFQNIIPHSNVFHSVSRFDAEKECENIDGVISDDPSTSRITGHPRIKTKVETSCKVLFITSCCCCRCKALCTFSYVLLLLHPVLTEQEKLFLATREKDKGNEAFRSKDYEEAVAYYSRSDLKTVHFSSKHCTSLWSIYHLPWLLIRLQSFIPVCLYISVCPV